MSAAKPLVDTAESSLGSVVDRQTIESLPTNGRNFNDFALLTPGATTDGDFGMISFNGVAGNFNNYTVDGGNNNNAFFSQQIGRTSIPFQFSEDVIREFDGIAEFRVELRTVKAMQHVKIEIEPADVHAVDAGRSQQLELFTQRRKPCRRLIRREKFARMRFERHRARRHAQRARRRREACKHGLMTEVHAIEIAYGQRNRCWGRRR